MSSWARASGRRISTTNINLREWDYMKPQRGRRVQGRKAVRITRYTRFCKFWICGEILRPGTHRAQNDTGWWSAQKIRLERSASMRWVFLFFTGYTTAILRLQHDRLRIVLCGAQNHIHLSFRSENNFEFYNVIFHFTIIQMAESYICLY